MIGWEYPPHNSGGLGEACAGLTKALWTHGHQVYFTLPFAYPMGASVSHLDLVTWDVPLTETQEHPFFGAYSTVPTQQKETEVIEAWKLATLPQSQMEQSVEEYAEFVVKHGVSKQDDYEIIHAHDWMSFPAAVQLQQETGKPLVAHVHSTEFDRIPNGHGSDYIHQTEYRGIQAADTVIAVSDYTKRVLVDKYQVPAEKIQVVHNGVEPLSGLADPGNHHFAPRRPVIAFMGRLTMQKGAEYFLQLAHKVLRELPEALFVVAGNGDQYHSLLFQTGSMGLSASVVFSGFVRGKEREVLLDRANIFVMPSLSEPFGLVALEAAQRHTPVIVSPQSGVAEVLPSAKVIDFWDIDQMARTIVELVTHPSQANRQAEQQLQEVKAVSWDRSASLLDTVYQQLLGR